jgi:hypothetical protein
MSIRNLTGVVDAAQSGNIGLSSADTTPQPRRSLGEAVLALKGHANRESDGVAAAVEELARSMEEEPRNALAVVTALAAETEALLRLMEHPRATAHCVAAVATVLEQSSDRVCMLACVKALIVYVGSKRSLTHARRKQRKVEVLSDGEEVVVKDEDRSWSGILAPLAAPLATCWMGKEATVLAVSAADLCLLLSTVLDCSSYMDSLLETLARWYARSDVMSAAWLAARAGHLYTPFAAGWRQCVPYMVSSQRQHLNQKRLQSLLSSASAPWSWIRFRWWWWWCFESSLLSLI